jgi:hypothetical protein
LRVRAPFVHRVRELDFRIPQRAAAIKRFAVGLVQHGLVGEILQRSLHHFVGAGHVVEADE